MNLVIVESPSKSKTISKYLGPGFVVRASVGHVRDLPKSSKKAIDIEGGFIPHYEVVPKKEIVIADIAEQASKASEIILATDPDREGEAIAWHIGEVLKERLGKNITKKMKRITFHEITKEAVQEAMQAPREIDQHLREAQEARRVLDRLFGYDLSGLIWKKVRYGLSAGRVQSPAMRIIMEREREIRAFVPEKYWTIEGHWKTKLGATLALTCSKEPRDETEVKTILEKARSGHWKVTDVEESEQKRSPRAPFITSTLQQAASSRLGYSPSRTMQIAQKLYEAGHITYMRTDSTNLGSQALAQIAESIESNYGKGYISFRKYNAKSKNAQEAHEAIRPSHFSKMQAGLNDEQKRLYKMIWQRAVSSQMADARVARTKVTANTDPALPEFTVTGSRIVYDGWLKADPESAGDDVIIPSVDVDDELKLLDIDSTEKQTEPPSRYTEAGLIKELEKRGIGRPSTYASICRTIEERGYVEKLNKSLKPTDTGDVVSSFVEEYFPSYISDSFTAEMEDSLDNIAGGTAQYEKTLRDFYKPFHADVLAKDKIAKITNLGDADSKYKCPKCGSKMEIKLGKNGKFLSCSRYPDCDGALTIDGLEFKPDEPIGTDPVSGLPIFVMNGRFGPYVQLGIREPKKKKAPRVPKVKGAKQKSAEVPVNAQSPTALDAPVSEVPAEKTAKPVKPKMASIPKTYDPTKITVTEALMFLSLPRTLGIDPKTGKDVVASAGRFGPYIVSDGNFRSIKVPDDVYKITLERALEMLAIPKAVRKGFGKLAKK
jgi:DNA topoisomerase-1